MCIAAKLRTLKGQRATGIYEYFEQNGVCEYVHNLTFLHFMTGQEQYRKTAVRDPEAFAHMVNGIKNFVEIYENWKIELYTLSITGFMLHMEANHLFPKGTPVWRKAAIAYSHLCYYMGMLAIDINVQ